MKQLSRSHSETANFDPVRAHVQARKGTDHIRWFVAAREIDGDISYRVEHLDFRSYQQGRKQLDRFSEDVQRYRTVNGRSLGVYFRAGCANATGKGERGGSPVNAQMHGCMRAMTTKPTNEHRTSRSCLCCRKIEVEADLRTKSGCMRFTNLGCAALHRNIDRDLDVETKNIVRAGRAEQRNEEGHWACNTRRDTRNESSGISSTIMH